MSLLTASFFKRAVQEPRQVISEDWSVRSSIIARDVNLFCWKRSVRYEIYRYLKELIDRDLKSIRFYTNTTGLEQRISEVRSVWDEETNENSDAFWKDVTMLVDDFLRFSEDGAGTVHLKQVKDNACTKFHVDGYSLRLFTTYFGKGTEWLAEKAVNRRGLGKTNEVIVKDNRFIQRMNPFDVGILKGEIPYQRNKTKGIIHRSPEIENDGERRIILRIDL